MMILCGYTFVVVCGVHLLDTHFRLRASSRCLVLGSIFATDSYKGFFT